jgi:hypothetical protein
MNDRIPWLTASLPDGQMCTWPLDKDSLVIGREEPADLALPFMAISRQHARISRVGFVYLIADLGSRNGTFLNGEPLDDQPRRLSEGDVIVLGGAVTLQFHDPSGTVESPRVGMLKGIWISPETREVWVDARRVDPPLSPSQLALLERLNRSAGQVISRNEVIAAVWPEANPEGVSDEAVDGLIKRLRARLRQAQPEREVIEVLRGQGVRILPMLD